MQKNEIGPLSYTIHKNQLKMKNLSITVEITQLLEEKIGKNLRDIDLGNDFLDMTLKVQATKAKIDK